MPAGLLPSGGFRDTFHGRAVIGSRGISGQAATVPPSRAQLSAMTHHCVQVRSAVGSEQDRYVTTARACPWCVFEPQGCSSQIVPVFWAIWPEQKKFEISLPPNQAYPYMIAKYVVC